MASPGTGVHGYTPPATVAPHTVTPGGTGKIPPQYATPNFNSGTPHQANTAGVNAGAKAGVKGNPILATQQWLRAHGFMVPLDGKVTPLYQSALSYWHQGTLFHAGGPWNRAHGLATVSGNASTHTPAVRANTKTAQTTNGTKGSTTANAAATANQTAVSPTGVPATSMPNLNIPLNAQSLDPETYAAQQVALKYGPLLSQIASQRGALVSGLPTGLGNIDQWYGAAATQAAQGATQDQAIGQQGVQAVQDAAARLIAAYGGSADQAASQSVATRGTGAVGLLSAQKANQAQIDNALQTGVQQTQAGAKSAYTNVNNQRINALDMQANSTEQAQQADQANYVTQAMQLNDQFKSAAEQRRASELSQRLSAALAGPQIQAANLANQATTSNITNNNTKTQLAVTAQKAAIQNQKFNQVLAQQSQWDAHQRSVLQIKLAKQNAVAATRGTTFSQLITQPGFDKDLQGVLGSQKFSPTTGLLNVNPQAAYNSVFNQLRNMYPKADPARLRQYAGNLVVGWRDNSPFKGHWTWNGHGFSKT